MAERKLNFVNAGEQDVSEVRISTGLHPASLAAAEGRVTYTISYPGPRPGTPTEAAADHLKEMFVKAAETIANDANERDVTPGQL